MDDKEAYDVYEPREDSFLLLDAMGESLPPSLHPYCILEIGVGSGCIVNSLQDHYPTSYTLGIDINPIACRVAHRNHPKNNIVQSDLRVHNFTPLFGKVDIMVFNPPYIPSDPIDTLSVYDLSWAGGAEGMVMIYPYLTLVGKCLSYPNGIGYLVVEKQNPIDEVLALLDGEGMVGEVIKKRQAINETLFIIKITHPPQA